MDLNELSNEDLAILLNELETEDELLYSTITETEQSIEKEEALDFTDTSELDTSDVTDVVEELAQCEGSKSSKRALTKLPENKTRYKIKIQRLAISQNKIKLSDIIPNSDLQALIRVITKKRVLIAEQAQVSANKRLRRLLNSLIPIQIRRFYNVYPWITKRCPGFIYYTTYTGRISGDSGTFVKDGPEITFWAAPDVPYFFRQGTEQNILNQYRSDLVYLVDNAVNAYHKYQKMQEQRALGVASRLIKNQIRTYFDLLMYNPHWFEILYNSKKDD